MPINERWYSKGSEEGTTIIDNSLKKWKYVFHYHALRVVEYFQPLQVICLHVRQYALRLICLAQWAIDLIQLLANKLDLVDK